MDFKVAENKIQIGSTGYTILSVTNFDELYEQLLAKGLTHEEVADERIPYWAELWPAAVGLAKHIEQHTAHISGKAILEIGCGLGLPALAAARAGGAVTATDYLQDAVDFAERNALLNSIRTIRFRTLDWRQSGGMPLYDVLLASDVVYERKQFEHLHDAFQHLVKPDGLILLSEPNRYIAEPFLSSLMGKGYTLTKYSYEVMVREVQSKVSVYAIRRK